ncbi:hypothetical protein D3C86_1342550 [compost metagenome]
MRLGCSMRSIWASKLSFRSSVRLSSSALQGVSSKCLALLAFCLLFFGAGQASAITYGPNVAEGASVVSSWANSALVDGNLSTSATLVAPFKGKYFLLTLGSPSEPRKLVIKSPQQLPPYACYLSSSSGAYWAQSSLGDAEILFPAGIGSLTNVQVAFMGEVAGLSSIDISEVQVFEAAAEPSPGPSSSPGSSPPPSSSSVDLNIPVIQDPAWLPVWEKGFGLALQCAALFVFAFFMWRVL